MINKWTHSKDQEVYPGNYNPMPDTGALLNKISKTASAAMMQPPVNMDELDNCFVIDIFIPGVTREEMLLSVHENILTVQVLHKKQEVLQKNTVQIHEFDNDYFERHLLLPANADTTLIIATYNQGILNLHIPKSSTSMQADDNIIVVY